MYITQNNEIYRIMKVKDKYSELNEYPRIFFSDKFQEANQIDPKQIKALMPLIQLLIQNKEVDPDRQNDINEPDPRPRPIESPSPRTEIQLERKSRRILTHLAKAYLNIYEIRNSNGTVERLFLKINPIEELLSQSMHSLPLQLMDSSEFYSHHPIRWIKGQVPYELSQIFLHKSHSALKKNLLSCIKILNKKTIIKFVPKDESSPDFVHFNIDTKVQAPIGRHPGRNQINLHPATEPYQIFHYLMHTLGFVHEVKNQFSKPLGYILDSNIQNSQISATEKIKFICGDTLGPYDKSSVLQQISCYHQESNPFEKQVKVKELSKLDIKKIEFFYGPRRCSYDFYKVPFFQTYFLCTDCWGDSKFFICFYCKEFHHEGHKVRKICYEDADLVSCCCGIIGHGNTCSVYLKKEIEVQGVRCRTCEDFQMGQEFKVESVGQGFVVCFRCFEECHKGHVAKEKVVIKGVACMCGKDGMVTNCCMKE